ncbi:hypothetical protein AArcMg_1551 [Natrarchaeobaculum sulfurireducens]|uniref:Uncharacterized protein n=1 Tax=Natrarchaeobaculum sulfurireducens TaxID=2044521 RepID=A0A346PPW8_9EURY|nr:hypothetical protein AArcMg_1551 [Natrarchaeobaculum sulfurireducens]
MAEGQKSERMSRVPWEPYVAGLWDRWTALERDWRSVAVGAMIVGSIALLDLQVPW